MSKTTNKYSLEVRERAVRMVLDNERRHESRWSAILDNERRHESRWSAILSISSKIGCTPQTLNDWVKKGRGRQRQAGRYSDGDGRDAEGLGTRELRTAAEILRKLIL